MNLLDKKITEEDFGIKHLHSITAIHIVNVQLLQFPSEPVLFSPGKDCYVHVAMATAYCTARRIMRRGVAQTADSHQFSFKYYSNVQFLGASD